MDSALFNKYFENLPDESVIFKGSKLIIQIPQTYLDQNIGFINRTMVTTLGIYEGFIYDSLDIEDPLKYDHKFIQKLPGNVILTPSKIDVSSITVEDDDTGIVTKEKVYNLIFLNGDTYILSTNLVQDVDISDKFINLLLGGKLPGNIRYDEVSTMWQDCAAMNGTGDLESNYNTFALIVMNLTRDPKDLSVQFRHVYEKYYEKGIFNGKMVRYMDVPKYISNFTSLTSADPKHGLTVAMARVHGENQEDIPSPVEEMIK